MTTSVDAARERSVPYAPAKRQVSVTAPAGAVSARPQGDIWERLMTALREKKPGLAGLLGPSRVLESSDTALVIGLAGSSFQLDQVNEKENRAFIEQLAADMNGRPMAVSFRLIAEGKNETSRTPAPRKTPPRQPDPLVQDALSIFNGQVVDTDRPEKK